MIKNMKSVKPLTDASGEVRELDSGDMAGMVSISGLPVSLRAKLLKIGAAETIGLIPHEVVSATVDGATPVRAWREYLKLTQAEVAGRLGISQPSYAKQENSENLRPATIAKIAAALGITEAQLDI